MSLSKLSKSNATPVAKAAAAPPAQPDPAPAVVEPETAGEMFLPAVAGNQVSVADALSAALTKESSAVSDFAIVNLTGGPSGGMFAPAEYLPQEVQDVLPSGKRPIAGVLMGYRLSVSAWPVGYTDAPAAVKGAEKSRPVYSAAVSANDIANLPLVMKAARNYQFTKGVDKSKFDYATSKAGHIRVAVEFLVFSNEVQQPIVVSTPSNFGAVETTLQGLQELTDKATGALGQFPCDLRAVTVDKSSKGGFTWKEHSISISKTAGTTEGAEGWKGFEVWRAAAKADPAVVASVRGWIGATDRPISADIVAALKAAAAL